MVTWALKEWAAAVTALLAGDTVLLLRKGGIREQRGPFSVAARQVLLLPTVEHQTPALLKPEFRPLISPGNAPTDSKTVYFRGWAEITHVFDLSVGVDPAPLLPYLIWNQPFLQERLRWRPDRPLYGLILRTYTLNSPVTVPRTAALEGCRSWVPLEQPVAVENTTAVLGETEYQRRVERILAAMPIGSRLVAA
ncbi:MAG: DUF1802 family protein [Nodosilinea sp.]